MNEQGPVFINADLSAPQTLKREKALLQINGNRLSVFTRLFNHFINDYSAIRRMFILRKKVILYIQKDINYSYRLTLPARRKSQLVRFLRKNIAADDKKRSFLSRLFSRKRIQVKVFTPRRVLAYLIPIVLFLFIFINYGYHLVPARFDSKLGGFLADSILHESAICDDKALNNFVDRMQEKLVDDDTVHHYRVHIISDSLVNAFALPGGTILLYSGLIEQADSASEVAGIMAHEIAHVENRDGMRQLFMQVALAMMTSMATGSAEISDFLTEITGLNYSREAETRADLDAVRRLHKNGLSHYGLAAFFKRMAEEEPEEGSLGSKVQNFFSTHPVSIERVSKIEKTAADTESENRTFKKHPVRRSRWLQIRDNCSPLH